MSYIITQKEVTTRKEQKCFGCARIFPRNTKMLRETVKDDIIFTAYLCPTCQEVMFERSGDDFCEGDLYELAVEAEEALERMRGGE